MCSCWDRWGSHPSFEVLATEVVASRGSYNPLCKIFRTESHWATSFPSVFLQTMLGFNTVGLLLSRNTLQKIKTSKRLQIHHCAATVKNSLRIISLCRQEFRRFDLWERKQEKNTTPHSPFKSIHLNIVMSSVLLFTNLHKSISSSSLTCCQSWFESIGEIPGGPSVQANTVLQTIENPWSLLLSPGSRERGGQREGKRDRHTRVEGKQVQQAVSVRLEVLQEFTL